MELKTLRNIAIILVAAFAIAALPAGGDFAALVLAIISLAFMAAIASLGWRLYRENQLTLWSMTTQHRAALYGALAACFMALAATSKLWSSGVGIIIWFAVVIGSGFTVFTVIRETRRYTI